MNHRFESQTFIDGADELRDACGWLSGLGISCSPTRLGRYQNLLNELSDLQAKGQSERLLEKFRFDQFVNAAFEAAQIVDIVKGLRVLAADAPEFVDRMRKALKGHEMRVLDLNGSSGRDFTFELVVAARFSAKGINVEFTGGADVAATLDGRSIFVECKRVRSAQQIPKRIKQCLDQLEERYNASPSPGAARGFAAISINDLINPKFGVLRASSDSEVSALMSSRVAQFIKEYQHNWVERAGSGRTIGVLVCLDAPAMITSEDMLTMAHHIGARPMVPEGTADFDLLKCIAATIT